MPVLMAVNRSQVKTRILDADFQTLPVYTISLNFSLALFTKYQESSISWRTTFSDLGRENDSEIVAKYGLGSSNDFRRKSHSCVHKK